MPDTNSRLARARQVMNQHGIDVLLVPTGDAHLSEYISERWQTRAYLSGFTGSAGTLVITGDIAGLWVDSRYHMRADSETAGTEITVFKQGRPATPEVIEWLSGELAPGSTLSLDPEAVSAETLVELREKLNAEVRPVKGLVDAIWTDRAATEPAPLAEHPLAYAGESAAEKLSRLRARLSEIGATSILVTGLDEVAWLLNLRGSDVPLNPVALAFCVVSMDGVRLFVHQDQVSTSLAEALQDEVEIRPYDSVVDYLSDLPAATSLALDPAKTSVLLYQAAEHMQLVPTPSPVQLLKAVKNSTELEGAAEAYLQDGIAVTRLLHWLSVTDPTTQTELSVAEKPEEFPPGLPADRARSYETIVGFGPNSSVGHYKLDRIKPQALGPDDLLLLDCGVQFSYGTTDTTRTVVLGRPTADQKRTYTTVLKSLIMLGSARFPKGTTGQQLDAIARYQLWNQLWDCRHGIGHGIGSYLHVHEGPQRINRTNQVAFEPGMMNSCEPGVYFEGEFGVRLENVIVTAEAGESVFGDFYRFDTLTLCPFDRVLIDVELLDEREVAWLDRYHRRVFDRLAPHLSSDETDWLAAMTARL